VSAQQDYEVVPWKQIYKMVISQASKICHSSFKPDVLVGMSRGGWIPARILSDLLENSNLANVRVESYLNINESINQPRLTQRISVDVVGKTVLVVDEVADSGKSLRLVVNHISELGAREVKTATLFYKQCCTLRPDYFEKTTNHWVVFPWEFKETFRQIYETYRNNPAKIEKEIEELVQSGFPKQLVKQFLNAFSEVKTC
jgi:uncharacterized protein